jgi:hypothetical protein
MNVDAWVFPQDFDKWAIDFIGLINPPTKRPRERYIIIAKKYLIRWAEAEPIRDCNVETIAWFLFENEGTRFGCMRILMSDQGTHFMNRRITTLIEEFYIHQQKSTPYHP